MKLFSIIFSIITCSFSLLISHSNGRSLLDGLTGTPPVRAVNLGGWLVTEGWILPSLFDGIPNKDLLDGSGVQFKSVTVGKYLCAENGGGNIIVANRPAASGWETFSLWRINATHFNFRVFNRQFMGLNTAAGNGVDIVATANTPAVIEIFEIQRNPNDPNRVRIKASNGKFLQVKTEELVSADYEGNGGWGDNNPSVFLLSISGGLHGEYQVTNGYGPLASQVMREHWRTYIVEEDFKFIKDSGLNAVRIPVGWWIASDPSPPKPYVGGSLQALDNAFSWAQKYGIKVIVDLHAAPGSQNGWEHSSSRDGSIEWGQTDENIQQTVDIIDFLTARYAKSPSLFAVELINEPRSPAIPLDRLSKYYKAGYDAVRKHTSTAYVILSNRLGDSDPKELFSLANGFTKSVIDVHYYNLFSSIFDNWTVQQHIDYVFNNRTAELNQMQSNGAPLLLIGEWVAELPSSTGVVSKEDYQRYAKAQLQVFGRATFGWAYWCLKNVNNHWSLEWNIKNGIISLT